LWFPADELIRHKILMNFNGVLRNLHLAVRGIVVFNFVLLLVDESPAGYFFNRTLRWAHLYHAAYYWLIVSTLVLPAFLIIEAIERALQRKRKGADTRSVASDRAILIDAILVVAWLCAITIGLIRSAGAFAVLYPFCYRIR